MAWEHYTNWLTAEDHSISRLQAEELANALRERVQATGLLMPPASTYTRHPIQRQVVPPPEFAPQPRPINWVISSIAERYMRFASGAGTGLDRFWTAEALWEQARSNLPPDLRPPSSLLGDMRSPTPSSIYTRHYWNLCRSAIQVLQWPVYRFNPEYTSRYVGSETEPLWPGNNWETAFEDWISAPDLPGIPGSGTFGMEVRNQTFQANRWRILGVSLQWELDFPAIPYGNGPWGAWTRVNVFPYNDDEFVPATMRVKIGTEEHDESVNRDSSSAYRRWSLGEGWTVTGPLAVELRLLPYPSRILEDYSAWIPSTHPDNSVRLSTEISFEQLPPSFVGNWFLATTPQFMHP